MARDLVIPVLLAAALMVMAGYAMTGEKAGEAAITATPAACQNATLIGRLAELPEASGLAASQSQPQLFWSHNDSADPTLYAIGPDGTVRGRVRIDGASVVDWEAVTTAACPAGECVYIGDIGDNERKRPNIVIYRLREPSVAETTTTAEAFVGTYPEGPQDAEALFVIEGSVFVVTKGEDAPLRLYRFPLGQPGERTRLELVTTLSPDATTKSNRVTDAAISPDRQHVVLRTNDRLFFYPASALVAGQPGTPAGFDLRPLREPQGEGIAWADARTLYLAGEAAGGGTLARLTCTLTH